MNFNLFRKSIFLFIVLIILVTIVVSNCSASKKTLHYSRENIPTTEFKSLFENVPLYQEPVAYDFILELAIPKYKLAANAGFEGDVVFQVLIDELADVEAIYVVRSENIMFVESVKEAIKRSTFKSLLAVTGKKGKYSLLLTMNFWIGKSSSTIYKVK